MACCGLALIALGFDIVIAERSIAQHSYVVEAEVVAISEKLLLPLDGDMGTIGSNRRRVPTLRFLDANGREASAELTPPSRSFVSNVGDRLRVRIGLNGEVRLAESGSVPARALIALAVGFALSAAALWGVVEKRRGY